MAIFWGSKHQKSGRVKRFLAGISAQTMLQMMTVGRSSLPSNGFVPKTGEKTVRHTPMAWSSWHSPMTIHGHFKCSFKQTHISWISSLSWCRIPRYRIFLLSLWWVYFSLLFMRIHVLGKHCWKLASIFFFQIIASWWHHCQSYSLVV